MDYSSRHTQTFITSIEVAEGQPLTVPATHVAYNPEHGYSAVSGVGRQASTAGAAQ